MAEIEEIRKRAFIKELEERCEELEKKSKSDTELIDAMRRHIKLLEDRDKERSALVAGLETQCRELRERLSDLLPSE